NERVKLAASFWNNVGSGMVIGGMAAAFFLDKPEGTWTKIGIAIAGLLLGWLCYSIASNIFDLYARSARRAPQGQRVLQTKRDDRWRRFQNRIEFGYEQHCLRTPNSGRSYARRAHPSRSCARSWMSPSVGSILGEQGQQPADQCRLYAREHRTGA